MSDDWRLRVDLREPRRAFELSERLQASDLEHELQQAFADRIVVSRDDSEVFCYAGTRAQADGAMTLITAIASERGWELETELRRWHPVAEQWEGPDTPLPSSEAERAAEHASLIEREREEAHGSGTPDFEVRVRCRSHRDATLLAERLTSEGIPHLRRWSYLVIGTEDEDSATALAERIRTESPPGSIVSSEGTEHIVRASVPPNPFAIFGGLGV